MIQRLIFGLFVLFVCFVQFSALAVDFSAADALFKQRESGTQAIENAHAAYAHLATAATGHDFLYAYEQMSRLRFYQGLAAAKIQDRIDLAMTCANEVEAIRTVDGVTPIAYYYWKALCLISWGRYNQDIDPFGTMFRTQEMADLIAKGIKLDPTYEGGGCHRLGAALYVTLPTINLGGPTQDLDKAARYAELAIASKASEREADPETATGDYFYKVYEAKGRILAAQGNRAAAKAVVLEALGRIRDGDLPVGREPETRLDERGLNEFLVEIGQ